jgi:protein-S-isoprenylcysteine O-methyltransferase Ste14
LREFRRTRTYDLLAASPLILFNGFAASGAVIRMAQQIDKPLALSGASEFLNLLAYAAVAAFVVLQTIFLLIRTLPQQFSQDLFSRAIALAASNGGLLLFLLPRAAIAPTLQTISSLLIFGGASASTLVMIWLGKGFSVLPQARHLTVHGPYRLVRHPLYLCETVTTIGLMLQYAQPWSLLYAVAITALQFPRMMYEERVLSATFPGYRAYAERTALFLPYIF